MLQQTAVRHNQEPFDVDDTSGEDEEESKSEKRKPKLLDDNAVVQPKAKKQRTKAGVYPIVDPRGGHGGTNSKQKKPRDITYHNRRGGGLSELISMATGLIANLDNAGNAAPPQQPQQPQYSFEEAKELKMLDLEIARANNINK